MKVSVEVRSGTARFRVAVRAVGIGRAASLVGEWYSRGGIRADFLTKPRGRVANGPGPRAAHVA